MALPCRVSKVDCIQGEALDGPLDQALPLLRGPLSHLASSKMFKKMLKKMFKNIQAGADSSRHGFYRRTE